MVGNFKEFFGPGGLNIGPVSVSAMGFKYERRDKTEVVRIPVNPEAKKEDIKVRLVKPGQLEVEWPRENEKGEEIPIE